MEKDITSYLKLYSNIMQIYLLTSDFKWADVLTQNKQPIELNWLKYLKLIGQCVIWRRDMFWITVEVARSKRNKKEEECQSGRQVIMRGCIFLFILLLAGKDLLIWNVLHYCSCMSKNLCLSTTYCTFFTPPSILFFSPRHYFGGFSQENAWRGTLRWQLC